MSDDNSDIADEPSGDAKPFRWHCTPESAAKGEVSALAILETVLATSISVWIAWRHQTTTHLLVGAVVAPFLLLRTEASTIRAIRCLSDDGLGGSALDVVAGLMPTMEWTHKGGSKLVLLVKSVAYLLGGVLLILPAISVVVFVVRVSSLLSESIRRPHKAIVAVPRNWMRYCLATDISHPPEVIPGLEQEMAEGGHPEAVDLRFGEFIGYSDLKYRTNWDKDLFLVLGAVIAIYVPAYLFRLSLKSTSIVYAPFLFIIRGYTSETMSADEYIKERSEDRIVQLQWWYSLLIFLVTATTITSTVIASLSLHWVYTNDSAIFEFLRAQYLLTDGEKIVIKGWPLARLANCAIVVWLSFYASRARLRLESGRWTSEEVKNTFERWRFTQIVLSLYTITCSMIWLIRYALSIRDFSWLLNWLDSIRFQLLP